MAVTVGVNTSALNMNSGLSTLTVPAVLAASGAHSLAVAHIAINSAVASVESVVDNNGVAWVQKAFQYAQRQIGATSFTNVTDLPGGEQDYNWGADINTTADQITEGQVRGEAWVNTYGTSASTSITVTLTSGARFAVEVETYQSGSNSFGATGSAAILSSGAPQATLTGGADTSHVSTGFSSASGLNQTANNVGASTTTIKNEEAGQGGSNSPVSLTLTETTSSSTAFTPSITPTNTITLPDSISEGGEQGNLVTIPVPATYALCLVEVLA
jgi:hypothetical protein